MRRVSSALVLGGIVLLALAAPASAKLPVLKPASYPGMTTYNCRTDAITLQPGQNLNKYELTKACPHAEVVDGPGDTSIFEAGSGASGFITRFQPSMVEIKPSGKTMTPAVWDLHLHHVVWLPPGGGVLAAGEEKTIAMPPQGYGIEMDATANWGLVHMLHNLTAEPGRQVYLTWQIDWVPQTDSRANRHLAGPRRLHGRRQRRRLPGLRRSAELRRGRERQVHLPRGRLDRPRRSEQRGDRQDQRRPVLDGSPTPSPTGSRCSRPEAICIRAGSTSTSRSLATVPTPGPPTATIRARSGRCSAPTRTTSSRPEPSAGTSP